MKLNRQFVLGMIAGAVLVVVLIVTVFLGGAAILQRFAVSKHPPAETVCENNLRMIDSVKNQWAMANGKKNGDIVVPTDISEYMKEENIMPRCSSGGTYTINPIGEDPTCSYPNHGIKR